jgi:hypothetical protein
MKSSTTEKCGVIFHTRGLGSVSQLVMVPCLQVWDGVEVRPRSVPGI